jgi:hypothetical protein
VVIPGRGNRYHVPLFPIDFLIGDRSQIAGAVVGVGLGGLVGVRGDREPFARVVGVVRGVVVAVGNRNLFPRVVVGVGGGDSRRGNRYWSEPLLFPCLQANTFRQNKE